MSKQIIKTDKAPSPIGPYSQAVKANGMVFLSGQVAFDPASGELRIGDLQTETHQVMKNLAAVMEEAHITFEHVVKTSIFLSDMAHFAQVNEVYGSYFKGDYPARETVAVKQLPRGVNVEISMIAVVDL
ncbi:MAG: RidA family protein [Sediminibacterium sp. Gen4]|jgi:2-iminobutanoate/2-iminopropanoate deaminase|uniref:RidA family protein n=1 Tax=unclassified Sediminibacterium TaxID=2635961 RepID=UPI0015BD4EA4|nr:MULTISPECIES: RidA family protein [unclassified Sediminibacterium]MBW0160355.1 RidA family protein [Sediminibacterium sp.]MBW0163220.1 RidA family protein [Sediminibacterium sp.]NWK65296.1 RidA family protein [Sediminibacterium sp. Gen4]